MSASGKLEIIKAHYGCNSILDVTDKCQKLAAANNGAFIVEAKTDFNVLFGDPEPGKDKKLTLLYRYGEGYQQQQIFNEKHDLINLAGISIVNGGVLTLSVHRATNLRDARTFGTQNPYAELSCGSEKFTTKVHEKGGKNPTWNQIFTFNLDGKDTYLHVFIKDQEMGTDGVIGRLDVHLPVLCVAKGENGYPVIHPNDFKKQCGEIVLTASFVDKTAPTKTAEATVTTTVTATPTVQPTVVMQPQPMAVSPQPQVIMQPQPQVVYQQPQQMMQQPQVVYQQPQMVQQPQVVYQPPVVQQPQVVYQQPQVVYQQPQVVMQQPQPTMVYAQPSQPAAVPSSPAKPVPSAPSTTKCHASQKQSGWRWCCKCMNMCYGQLSGVCAQGGKHDHNGSGAYHMPLASAHGCGAQDNWKWCNKCQCIAFAGGTPSVCAAGGSHNHGGSGSYYMCLNGQHGQVAWAWCKNCSVLFYGAMAHKSKCPATGGGHDQSKSGSYQVGHD